MAVGVYDMYVAAMRTDGLVKESPIAVAVDQVQQKLKIKQPVASSNVIDC
jgi:hypothetical protein